VSLADEFETTQIVYNVKERMLWDTEKYMRMEQLFIKTALASGYLRHHIALQQQERKMYHCQ
jgi:hypothetical protein